MKCWASHPQIYFKIGDEKSQGVRGKGKLGVTTAFPFLKFVLKVNSGMMLQGSVYLSFMA